MRFFCNIDLLKNELQNAVLHPLSLAPIAPKEGQFYYNSNDKLIYYYDGENWCAAGIVYHHDNTTSAVITGLGIDGSVVTTDVINLTLAGYAPIEDGHVVADMTMQQAFAVLDTAIKETMNAANEAQSTADAKVALVTADNGIEIGGTTTTPSVGIKLDINDDNLATLSDKGLMVTAPTPDDYTIIKDGDTPDYAAVYHLTKNGENVGTAINIPKDMVIKSGEIVENPEGYPEGTYLKLVLQNQDEPIYINVTDLIDVYTAGNGITISGTNVISVKVVDANGLSVDNNGVKLGAASNQSAGAMSAANFTKLSGIEDNATSNTITLNGKTNADPSFYAPAGGGASGQYLVSTGSSAPVWQNLPTILKKYTAQNTAITAVDGVFTWTISANTHGVAYPTSVQVFEVSTGAMVMANVTISNSDVKIAIKSATGSGTLAANTYRIVIIG